MQLVNKKFSVKEAAAIMFNVLMLLLLTANFFYWANHWGESSANVYNWSNLTDDIAVIWVCWISGYSIGVLNK